MDVKRDVEAVPVAKDEDERREGEASKESGYLKSVSLELL